MKRIVIYFITLFLLVNLQDGKACTSIIISGKVTPDGRPLMWKHRDTEVPFNHIAYFNDGGYPFIGLVNSVKSSEDVWTGSNETGFSIMNTASFNLKDDDVKEMDKEGALMRKALNICKTVNDFEHFLDTLSRPMRVEANFGVIDAFGGAAYFETKNDRYFKKDVNDPQLAPNGYLIYTNFSFEGRKDEGLGYIRYDNATTIFLNMQQEGYTPQRILQKASRSFYNSQLGIDLKKDTHNPNQASGWFVEQDMIPRKESTAAIVIQGVKPGTNPEMTTLWTALGYPPTAIAVPLWVKMGKDLPALVSYDKQLGTAPLCLYASQLMNKVYSIHRGNGAKYLHWQLLWNDSNEGYMQQVQETENRIFQLFNFRMQDWSRKGLDIKEVTKLYQELTPVIKETYNKLNSQPM